MKTIEKFCFSFFSFFVFGGLIFRSNREISKSECAVLFVRVGVCFFYLALLCFSGFYLRNLLYIFSQKNY
ncbi:MAG: hypothetical protein MRECE_2c092 [Mycoplasmataceae bacterium CE_OT135]|nr:MAG: hypothetical protein MRECE_2c092 [Mycoplasmataceae bacterium CE_OT135]